MKHQYLATIRVYPLEPRGPRGLVVAGTLQMPCRIGRVGVTSSKREGDGKSPRGAMRILGGFWRRDRRLPPHCGIALRPIRRNDGWCDAPGHAAYNRMVRLPFTPSHETMWREDHQYDVVLDLDWNRTCRRQGRGSAIFLHLMSATGIAALKSGRTGGGTAGCIAIHPARLDALLARIGPHTRIRIG